MALIFWLILCHILPTSYECMYKDTQTAEEKEEAVLKPLKYTQVSTSKLPPNIFPIFLLKYFIADDILKQMVSFLTI